MRVDDLIRSNDTYEELQILHNRCPQFLEEADDQPLMKNLPVKYGDFHKVKVRKRKHQDDDFVETFNEAFEDELRDLRERAVFANGPISFDPAENDELEPFYIFPIDGYRFMYSKEVENSSQDYKTVFDSIFEEFGADKGNEVITDLLKFTYTATNLKEGIESGSEVILYNIPYFYAIRASTVDDYTQLLTSLKEIEDNVV